MNLKSTTTPTPWEIDEIEDELHIVRVGGFPESVCALYSDPMDDETKANASAIVSAVNNTYGAGINPEAVPVLLKAFQRLLDDCLVGDFNEHWDSYTNAKEIMAKAKIK
jgi:hypothetical protein